MISHEEVWRGIDELARANGLSASGLAKAAGLDPTTFNKSKRATKQGRARWPSTESIAKVLQATNSSMAEFVALMQGGGVETLSASQRIKLASFRAASDPAAFDAGGYPIGGDWEEFDFPVLEDEAAFAIELDRDISAPLLRNGDVIVASASASVRKGDRVLLRSRSQGLMVGILTRRNAQRLSIAPFAAGEPQHFVIEASDLAWLARIIWVSQ